MVAAVTIKVNACDFFSTPTSTMMDYLLHAIKQYDLIDSFAIAVVGQLEMAPVFARGHA